MSAAEPAISIGRLELHCADAQQKQVLSTLDDADWPTTSPRELVVVRQLTIDGEAWSIGSLAAQQLRRLVLAAQRPDSGDIAQAAAVRFVDRGEYLAWACRESLHPGSTPAWFWSGEPLLSTNSSDSLPRLLADQPLWLPAAVDRLREMQLLVSLLRALGADKIQQLTQRLLHHTGYPLAADDAEAVHIATDASSVIPKDSRALADWRQTISQLPESSRTPAIRFAAILLLWQQTPQRLQRREIAAAVFAGLCRQLDQARPPGRTSDTSSNAGNALPDSSGEPMTGALQDKATDTSPHVAGNDIAPTTPNKSAQPATAAVGEQHNADSPQLSTGDWFITGQGGFFYLLNLLRLKTAQQLLRDSPHSAWQHLYLLSRLLGQTLDSALQSFIARQLQLSDAEALASLLPGTTERALYRLAEQRFAHQAFWPDALLTRRARVHHDTTHIDIDLHQGAVDLQIRLCGLDVDPGWLPWLGRVVRFHYLDDPLLREAEEPIP